MIDKKKNMSASVMARLKNVSRKNTVHVFQFVDLISLGKEDNPATVF